MFETLEKLPDDCIVYYEPLVRDRYPDFIVIIPDLGVLVIEVKGWYPGAITAANGHEVIVRNQGIEQKHPHPTRQAREYKFRLMDECAGQPFCGILLNSGGPHKGRFKIPFGHFAILSNISQDQLAAAAEGTLLTPFSGPTIITRDEAERWQALDAHGLKAELQKRFEPFWPIESLTAPEINALRAVIHPEIKISAGSDARVEQTIDTLKVLDLRQERNARQIRSGHRVIYGVAGSGKTVLLIARAKLLAEDESKKVLVLCYNKVLARYLGSILEHKNIDVRHFHQWGSENHISFRRNEGNDEYGERLLARLQCGEGNALQYDAVLIDEAQDFCRAWFMCAKMALKEPDDGDLIIVGDGGQSVYRRRPFTWADAGIHAVGRTINLKFDLNTNYRNTRQILAAAHTFARTPDANTKDADLSLAVLPDKSMRFGITPRMFDATNRGNEIELIAQLVTGWIKDGIAINGISLRLTPNDIGILYPRLRKRDEATLVKLRGLLSTFGTVRLAGTGADGEARDAGVKLTTIHSAKGLQFKAVILMWADLLPSRLEDRVEAEERSLFYIGLTRAEDILVVTHCGPSAYVDEMRESLANLGDDDGR